MVPTAATAPPSPLGRCPMPGPFLSGRLPQLRRRLERSSPPRHPCCLAAPSAGCPLCMEDLDVTDRNFRPCKCGYQICLFCYRHIKDDLNGLCPACRTPYDEANVTFVQPSPEE